MGKTEKWLKNTLLFLKKNIFVLFAIGVYIFFIVYYMGPGITKCNDSIYGFGDSTAGPIWKNSLKPEQPLFGGYQTSTNYPFGESLYSPVGFASAIQTVSMKVGTWVAGPVCAYNLYNAFGYLTTALAMFFFIRYLTRNRWVALLAGYAVAFTPYVQSKIGGHPSYGYASLLIGVLWLTLHFLTSHRKRHALLLATVLAFCAYFDPYFILLSITVVIPTSIAWLCLLIAQKKKQPGDIKTELKKIRKPLAVAIALFAVLTAPLVIIRIKDAALIESTVGSVRGDVTAAAMLCSNRPLDYLLPDPVNQHLVKIFGNQYTAKNIQHRNWCGFGESRVSISLTMLMIILLGGLVLIYKKIKGNISGLGSRFAYDPKLVGTALVAVGSAAFLIGLPPYIGELITPSGIILKVTEFWRIFAREYLVLNIVVVVLFSVLVTCLSQLLPTRGGKYVKAILLTILAVGIAAEYQINDPFSPMTFSYTRDVPGVYSKVRDNNDIDVIAEYPIDRIGIEHDSFVYYLTMQAVHGKSIFNSASVNNPTEKIHIALKDLTDPQTLPALRYFGIEHVVIHGEKPSDIIARLGDKVEILEHNIPPVYSLTMVRADEDRDVVLVRIKPGNAVSNILTIKKGYVVNIPLIQSPIGIEYETVQGAIVNVTPLGYERYKGSVCIDVKMSALGDTSKLFVKRGEEVVLEALLTDVYQRIRIDAKTDDDLILHNDRGYNMRLNNLNVGCNE